MGKAIFVDYNNLENSLPHRRANRLIEKARQELSYTGLVYELMGGALEVGLGLAEVTFFPDGKPSVSFSKCCTHYARQVCDLVDQVCAEVQE